MYSDPVSRISFVNNHTRKKGSYFIHHIAEINALKQNKNIVMKEMGDTRYAKARFPLVEPASTRLAYRAALFEIFASLDRGRKPPGILWRPFGVLAMIRAEPCSHRFRVCMSAESCTLANVVPPFVAALEAMLGFLIGCS
jgi:hypothetical protein